MRTVNTSGGYVHRLWTQAGFWTLIPSSGHEPRPSHMSPLTPYAHLSQTYPLNQNFWGCHLGICISQARFENYQSKPWP